MVLNFVDTLLKATRKLYIASFDRYNDLCSKWITLKRFQIARYMPHLLQRPFSWEKCVLSAVSNLAWMHLGLNISFIKVHHELWPYSLSDMPSCPSLFSHYPFLLSNRSPNKFMSLVYIFKLFFFLDMYHLT